ncbi:LOW QUALITY PROTEIN: uncharacterized protein LOC107995028 [Apis cerana]|uniref:LOW QUALITY PROTEIN: uncharacterized protein LOC107995028 n=1 Tax=Apis cerana TaxID=7461 RepID=UPI002B22AB27|nr:LOW QUALITY PROTEIN: uncharacterized protein LOC107995028 [Apis cerana]
MEYCLKNWKNKSLLENGKIRPVIARWNSLEVKGKAETMIQLFESSFSPRAVPVKSRPGPTKVASSSLKRVTEAEPTFASAWNRGPFSNPNSETAFKPIPGQAAGVFTRFGIMRRRDTSRPKSWIIPWYMGKANRKGSRACNNGL